MTKKGYMDTFYEVSMEGDPPLTVGADVDGLGLVRIFARSDEAKEYWGSIDFTIPPEMAQVMARALLLSALPQEAAGDT
jgi:hypothetical protein